VIQEGDKMILRAEPIGVPPSRRYVIQHLGDYKVWNGNSFVDDWESARKYATANDACADMADILRELYCKLPRKRYVCPVEIEVYGSASRAKIARFLHRATALNIKTDLYGNGPGDCLVLPAIHWGLLKEIEDVPMLSKVKNYESEDEDWRLEEDD
jgi:hypothetical protein